MSSYRKDARWAHAMTHTEDLGLRWEDLSFQGQIKMLNRAEESFNEAPVTVEWWYQEWLRREEATSET